MWDTYGLEALISVDKWQRDQTAWEKEKMWSILNDSNYHTLPPPKIPLQLMILRANCNTQRKYEIYEFETDYTQEEIHAMFRSSRKDLQEYIRLTGIEIYSAGVVYRSRLPETAE